ncbi:uncharacterized protein CIMG_13771 [Coccidioides immitis RS]|uniref:Uncharacterized protein n=1 Tax=Coccidioides immitis (strain RS) TaxID=246410 RepID=A0A0D8JWC2_COCIM|nr:uncharacterized protein CIMG_13771 [Coccidioides immitis RS]KJF61605.1 hypothetical protein CIMG_13771 [Coccidioides immitis RS]
MWANPFGPMRWEGGLVCDPSSTFFLGIPSSPLRLRLILANGPVGTAGTVRVSSSSGNPDSLRPGRHDGVPESSFLARTPYVLMAIFTMECERNEFHEPILCGFEPIHFHRGVTLLDQTIAGIFIT